MTSINDADTEATWFGHPHGAFAGKHVVRHGGRKQFLFACGRAILELVHGRSIGVFHC